MQRTSRVLIAGVLTVFASGGGLLAAHVSGSAVARWAAGGANAAQHAPATTLLGAMQAPAPAPAATSVHAPKPGPTKGSPPVTKPSPSHARTPAPSSAAIVHALLAQINQLRAANHLPPYTLLGGLVASAHKHNLTMIGGCGLSHQCPGEASLGSRVSAQGVRWTACGENIGYSGPHPDSASAITGAAEALTTAMYDEVPPDDGHRLNLLSTRFTHIGIDVVRDSSGRVWLTQDFSN
jgi:uncharacterized protein YkwD